MPLGNWFKSPDFWLDSPINAVVSDANAAGSWYRDKFGMKIRPKNAEDDGEWGDDLAAVVVCKFLDLQEESGIYLMQPAPGRDDGERLSGNEFIYCKDLGKATELLATRGVAVGAVEQDGDGSRYCYIQDPDGNKLQILEG